MLRNALFIAGKDIKYMLRAKETIVWVFFMPIVFFYFIGTTTGGFGRSAASKDKLALKAGENVGFLLDQLVRRLDERGYDVVRVDNDSLFATYGRRLTVPACLTDSVLAKKQVALTFTRSEGGMGFDYDSIRINRAIYTVLADVIVSRETGGTPTREALDETSRRRGPKQPPPGPG